MSNSRQFIANATKISVALEEARRQTDCCNSIIILEELMADGEIKNFLAQGDNAVINDLRSKYQLLLAQFSDELSRLSIYLAAQLDELENVKTDYNSPVSHTNMAYAFDNLAHFIVNEIIGAQTPDLQLIILKRWVDILHRSIKNADYHTAGAINAALQTDAIERLKTTKYHLTGEETKIMKDTNEALIRDQGWGLMQRHLANQEFFIPSLAGIKKTLTRAKEAGQTSSTTPPVITSLMSGITDLKSHCQIKHPDALTPFQRRVTPIEFNDKTIIIKPTAYDEGAVFAAAVRQELTAIPLLITKIQAELHKELNRVCSQKKLLEPFKTLKKKLRGVDLNKVLEPNFTSGKEFTKIKSALAALTDAPAGTAKANSKKPDLPSIEYINSLATDIHFFDKRHARLQRESSASSLSETPSFLSLITSTTSIGDSSTSLTSSSMSDLSTGSSQSSKSTSAKSAEDAPNKTTGQQMFHRCTPSAPTLTTDDKPEAKKLTKAYSFHAFSTPAQPVSAPAAARTTKSGEVKHPRKASLLVPRSSSVNIHVQPPTPRNSSADLPASTLKNSVSLPPDTPRGSTSGLLSPHRRTHSPTKPRPSGKITKKNSLRK